jgi:hypothetical protein
MRKLLFYFLSVYGMKNFARFSSQFAMKYSYNVQFLLHYMITIFYVFNTSVVRDPGTLPMKFCGIIRNSVKTLQFTQNFPCREAAVFYKKKPMRSERKLYILRKSAYLLSLSYGSRSVKKHLGLNPAQATIFDKFCYYLAYCIKTYYILSLLLIWS